MKNNLTIKEIRSRVSYDPETGKFTWLHSDKMRPCWNSRFVGKNAINAPHSNGYLFGAISDKKVFAHRAAWAIIHGEWPDEGEIDHINHDKTDNRVKNFRLVNRKENSKNLSKSSRNKSGVTGVFKHSQTGIWQAQIRVNGKSVHLGSFEVFEDAVNARKNAEEYHGFHQNHGI